MKKIYNFLIACFVITIISNTAYGQKVITGVVNGDTGVLPGVTVRVKGKPTASMTDLNGKYSIAASSADVLTFRYIGYKGQSKVVGDKTVINVTLKLKEEDIDEVVVVGYGSMKKSDLTGATTTVKLNNDESRSYSSVDNLLMGRSSGVSVISNSGNPGEAGSVRIRGSNSLRGNNEPLYVIDGVVITSAGEDVVGTSGGNESQQAINGLAGINPSDIESIEVLKDASATAIYGSRGSNGVVLITTKQGKKGGMKINAFGTYGVSLINKKLDVLKADDYARYQNEVNVIDGYLPDYHIDDNNEIYKITYDSNDEPTIDTIALEQVDWQDIVYQMGTSQSAGASASGASKKGSYYISSTFNKIGGIVENSKTESGNLRLNVHQKLNKKFSIDTRISVYAANNNFAQSGSKAGSSRSFIKSLVTYNPIIGADVEDFQNDLDVSNPLSWIKDFEDVTSDFRTMGAIKLSYQLPLKGLSFQVRSAGDLLIRERKRWYGITTNAGQQANGLLSISGMDRFGYTIDNLLLYKNKFKNHSINATAGYVFDHKKRTDNVYEVQDFLVYDFTINGPQYGQLAKVPYKIYPATEDMNSFLGRLNYSYGSKYSLTATFRADGSSKFQKGKQYSYFPSFSFAWRLGNENFMDFKNLSNLKLRAGWGLTGNQAIKPYQTFANYGVGYYSNYDNTTGLVFFPNLIPNPNLKWETTSQYNVGFDFGFFKNRISGAIDAYYKETYDLLQEIALPTSTGYESMLINRGTIANKGIDFSISGVIIAKKDFGLTLGGNVSINRNKILSLGIAEDSVYVNDVLTLSSYYLGDNVSSGNDFKCPANIFMVGQPIGMFFGWETEGIYQTDDTDILDGAQPGDVRIVDQNNDGVIDVKDRVIIGDPNPDFTYGITLDVSYKRFSLKVLTYGVYGNEIANGNALTYFYASGDAKNINPIAYNNAWREDSPSEIYARIGFSEEGNSTITDRIIEDGSYFRLSNLTLGYDIPFKKNITNIHVYFSGLNLYTFTNYSGFEPNITSFLNNGNIQGVDWNAYPNVKTYMFGLNISF